MLAGGRAQCIDEPALAFAGGTGELVGPECHNAVIARALALGTRAFAIVAASAIVLAVLANRRDH